MYLRVEILPKSFYNFSEVLKIYLTFYKFHEVF